MKKLYRNIIVLGLVAGFICPSISYADDIVKYDDSNLDEILDKYDIDYDKSAVNERIKNYKQDPNKDIVPDYKVTDVKVEERIIETPDGGIKIVKEEKENIKDVSPSPLYSKSPVYKRVVDISEHQNPGHINYDKFAKDIDGAILRTSIMDAETLRIRRDLYVEKHYQELNKRNVPLGFYHYSRAINAAEGIREAEFVYDVIKDKNVSMPVYIDIEDDKRQAKASKGDISEAAEAFIMTMKRHGFVAGIYSYPWFADKYLTKDIRNNNEFWVADLSSKDFANYKSSDFDSWQFSYQSRVDGYKYDVDMSVHYKDYPYIIKGKSRKPLNILIDEILAGKWGVGADRQKRLTYAGYDYKVIQAAVNDRLLLAKK